MARTDAELIDLGEKFFAQLSEEDLAHYGVKGMKWGVIREKVAGGFAKLKSKANKAEDLIDKTKVYDHKERRNADQVRLRAKFLGANTLSNKEIRETIHRMKLEREFKELYESGSAAGTAKKGARWLAGWLDDVSRRTATTAASSWVSNPLNFGTTATWGPEIKVRDAIEGSIVDIREIDRG